MIKNGRGLPLSLSSNVTVSTNPRTPVRQLVPQVDPDRGDDGVGRGFFVVASKSRNIWQRGHLLDPHDREVSGGVIGRGDWPLTTRGQAPCVADLPLHAEIIAVQLDQDRALRP